MGRHNGSELTSAGPERRRSRRDTKRKSSRESKKLQRDPERRRTYSFCQVEKTASECLDLWIVLLSHHCLPISKGMQGQTRTNQIQLQLRRDLSEPAHNLQRIPRTSKGCLHYTKGAPRSRHMDNPSSDISLPLAESLRSSVSANSDPM